MLRVFYCQATDLDGDDCSVVVAAHSCEEALHLWWEHHDWYLSTAEGREGGAYRGPLSVDILELEKRDTPGVVDWAIIDNQTMHYRREGSRWVWFEPAQTPRSARA